MKDLTTILFIVVAILATTVFTNKIKEQDKYIAELENKITTQEVEIDSLKNADAWE